MKKTNRWSGDAAAPAVMGVAMGILVALVVLYVLWRMYGGH